MKYLPAALSCVSRVVGFPTIDTVGLKTVICFDDSTVFLFFFLLGRRVIFMGSTEIANDC